MSEAAAGPIALGMVGGGPGAFIGGVHRMAAALDGRFRLAAGVFSSDEARSEEAGRDLGLDPERIHGAYDAMATAEAARDDGIRVVSIVTPNHLHHPVARAFLEAGIHVVCDKPLTTTLDDAEDLCRLAAERDLLFAVTYNYTGYPMVKEARERVRAGALGTVRKVVVEYSQGWLTTLLEAQGQKQAEWRGDPARAGVSSALGDIGTHAHDLARYVTGLEVDELFADLGTLVEGRAMEDDGTVLFRYRGGARGVLMVSQISAGERNHLRLRVYGSDGGLDWVQERPDELRLLAPSGDVTVLHRGSDALSDRAKAHTRLPGGHPEGFIEAFANVYRNVADSLRARAGGPRAPFADDHPTVQDGARGVHFVHAAVASAREGRWVSGAYDPPGAPSP
ncbi:MAG: Gfo/Idh/MocA family oxidoreductase [Longimicrobiales bacterium]